MATRLILFLSSFLGLAVAITWFVFNPDFEPLVTSITLVATFILSGLDLYKKLSIYSREIELRFSLMGQVASGKTVYLTVLFEELQRKGVNDFLFWPVGVETIERHAKNLTSLMNGSWVPASRPGECNRYEAFFVESVKRWKLRRELKLSYTDYSGEDINNTFVGDGYLRSEYDIPWIHKQPFFQDLVKSDLVLIAIDLGRLSSSEGLKDVNMYTAAIHLLAEEKARKTGKFIAQPVCILFLKADLLERTERGWWDDIDKSTALLRSQSLIKACESRCKHFRYFFVAAVGDVV